MMITALKILKVYRLNLKKPLYFGNRLGLYEFKTLSIENQAWMLWNKGVQLSERAEDSYKVTLFSLSDFYVEEYYNSKSNSLERFRTFKSVSCLEPYLETISLANLL